MKTGASSLNPYAASYVPLSKRAAADVDIESTSSQGLNRGNEAVWLGNQPENIFPQGRHQHVSQSYGHGDAVNPASEFSKLKDHHGGEFFTSTSQYLNEIPEKSNFDEDMDLAYLQMTFPGISYESLYGVYLTNKCDLDAAVDMINQLEIHPNDSPDKLPDTLDIGDVPESGSISEVTSQKVKNGTGEAEGTSSLGSSNLSSIS